MKDQVLDASSLLGWQAVSKCLVLLERHCCGASSAHTQLPGTGNTPFAFARPSIDVPVVRHMMGFSSTASGDR